MLKNIFKKEPKKCFGCSSELEPGKEYTIQYNTADGLFTQKVCEACSVVFDELHDIKNEAYNDRF